MQEMKYFVPNNAFDSAIKNNEKGTLKALLIGIIGRDPTFATTEYKEATEYVKIKSERLNGSTINLLEIYCKQEDEYTKPQENWDENYYRMLLVWYRDNYAVERLSHIKAVGEEVYKNKPTLGKTKRRNRLATQKQATQQTHEKEKNAKKTSIVRATGNDDGGKRLTIIRWIKRNWWLILIGIAILVGCYFAIK